MLRGDKELIVVGDRVLLRIDDQEQRTSVGLYLPPTAIEKESVQSGRVEEVGPGIPLPPRATDDDDVPWAQSSAEPDMRFIPLQASKGDFAIFARKEAIEIKFDDEKFVVVPHSAILVLIRSTSMIS
jgi:co-chaperonin GroES (HSP10)